MAVLGINAINKLKQKKPPTVKAPKNTTLKNTGGRGFTSTVPKKAAPKKAAPKKTTTKKSSGGAYGAGGKFYKNGYVDSKGNKVVNGRWVSPKKSSGGSSSKSSSSSKKSSSSTPTISNNLSAKATVKPKVSLLADDYIDQIYRNQIAELDSADAAFTDDNTAKVNRLTRDYGVNRGNVELNQTQSLQNSAEDFAARGMMRSGSYLENMNQTNKLFGDQLARMESNLNDDKSEYSRAKADYLRGSSTQRQEAKRQLADRIATENAKRAAQASS